VVYHIVTGVPRSIEPGQTDKPGTDRWRNDRLLESGEDD
jgi:hypothetical protein